MILKNAFLPPPFIKLRRLALILWQEVSFEGNGVTNLDFVSHRLQRGLLHLKKRWRKEWSCNCNQTWVFQSLLADPVHRAEIRFQFWTPQKIWLRQGIMSSEVGDPEARRGETPDGKPYPRKCRREKYTRLPQHACRISTLTIRRERYILGYPNNTVGYEYYYYQNGEHPQWEVLTW